MIDQISVSSLSNLHLKCMFQFYMYLGMDKMRSSIKYIFHLMKFSVYY